MKTLMLEDRPVKLQIVCPSSAPPAPQPMQVTATKKHAHAAAQWDTAGQERFHTLTESYYRNSHGVILVYDVTDRTSFDRIQKWAGQIDAYENLRLSKLLVGNKTDLAEKRMVTTAEGQELAQTLGMAFVETSAKSTDNVEQAFVGIATEILHNIEFALSRSSPLPSCSHCLSDTCVHTHTHRKGIVTSPTTTTGRVSLVAANPAACRDASESTERSCCRS